MRAFALPLSLALGLLGCGRSSSTPSVAPAPTAPTVENPPVAAPVAAAPSSAPEVEEGPAPTVRGDSCGLEAKVAVKAETNQTRYVLTLVNRGKKSVRLVVPGDGSESGWRTPVLGWTGKSADGSAAKVAPQGRCGMMNTITKEEIFDLAPGASRELKEWVDGPHFVPGTYEATLRYTNDPSRHRGASPEIAKALAATTACDVVSAPVRVTIPRI